MQGTPGSDMSLEFLLLKSTLQATCVGMDTLDQQRLIMLPCLLRLGGRRQFCIRWRQACRLWDLIAS